jgi:hypothetical protein
VNWRFRRIPTPRIPRCRFCYRSLAVKGKQGGTCKRSCYNGCKRPDVSTDVSRRIIGTDGSVWTSFSCPPFAYSGAPVWCMLLVIASDDSERWIRLERTMGINMNSSDEGNRRTVQPNTETGGSGQQISLCLCLSVCLPVSPSGTVELEDGQRTKQPATFAQRDGLAE